MVEEIIYSFKDLYPVVQNALYINRNNNNIFENEDDWFDLDNFITHNTELPKSFLDKLINNIQRQHK